MSNSEDLVIVESADYAQVVFDDVKDCYGSDKPLTCVFTLNNLLKADKSDWIGIYKVGFTNCNEFACNLAINLDLIKESKGKLTFQSDFLPKEDGEFYQFVYVSQGKQIRGASLPFQFKLNESGELIAEEDQDAIVVKYEINNSITEIKQRCAQLAKANETYENMVKENEQLIKSLREEVAAIKLRCFRLTMDNEKLNFTLRNKTDNLKNFADTITNLTNENSQLQSKYQDLSVENKNLVDSLQLRINQIDQLKTDLESVKVSKVEIESVLSLKECELVQLKKDKDELNRIAEDLHHINDQIVCLEKQVEERVEELNKIKQDLKKNEQIVSEQAQTIQNILNERDVLNGVIQRLTREKNQLEANHENLSQELNFSRDKLSAVEQSKEILKSQFSLVTDELDEAKKKHNSDMALIKELNEKLAKSEAEKAELSLKVDQMRTEQEETSGVYTALKLAHTHLERLLRSSESKRDLLERDNDMQKRAIELLEKDNEDLKERIKQGAKEYTKLFEKNRLLKNQRFNTEISHDMIDSSNSTCRSRLSRQMHNLTLSDHGHESDSAIQEKSRSAHVSTSDVDNTFLDALLGSSFYNNGDWSRDKKPKINNLILDTQMSNSHLASNQQTIIPATITQPKSQLSQSYELADDGLVSKNDQNKIRSQQIISSPFKQQPPQQHQIIPENFASNEIKFSKNNAVCEICEHIFATNENLEEIERHYSNHYGPSCPVCFLQFRKGYSQTELEHHVNSHFTS